MNASESKNRIKVICQACGASSDEVKAWMPRCSLHGGPVCMHCCSKCEHRQGMSGMKICTFKDPLRRQAEAIKRIRNREADENIRITNGFKRQRREEARKAAIKKAQQEKRRKQ